jgi:hypothetical protein
MYSVLLIAFWGIAPSVREGPVWITDYSEAKNVSQTEGKPIAAFLGSGATGWNDVSREGRLEKDAGRLLAKYYVCLYVDTASEEGRRLTRAFEMSESRGIVISSSQGKLQAFRHEGNLRNEDLKYYLERFSNPDLVVLHTESNPPERRYSTPATASPSYSTTRSC